MALGATTYKTPNIINLIGSDMTSKEGCGVFLYGANEIQLATGGGDRPYAVIVTGTDSLTPGTYPSAIGDASLEMVDQLGCVVQVLISTSGSVLAGEHLYIDANDADGTYMSDGQSSPTVGTWIWGLALTNADPSEQCLMRFQPYLVQA